MGKSLIGQETSQEAAARKQQEELQRKMDAQNKDIADAKERQQQIANTNQVDSLRRRRGGGGRSLLSGTQSGTATSTLGS